MEIEDGVVGACLGVSQYSRRVKIKERLRKRVQIRLLQSFSLLTRLTNIIRQYTFPQIISLFHDSLDPEPFILFLKFLLHFVLGFFGLKGALRQRQVVLVDEDQRILIIEFSNRYENIGELSKNQRQSLLFTKFVNYFRKFC